MRTVIADLVELVFPADCPGCGAVGQADPLCVVCAQSLRAARARIARPVPAPVDLPQCAALDDYHGVLRELLLGYKEHGRLGLGGTLGRGLATSVLMAAPAVGDLILVPVPATAAAARARGGDHIRRLARHAVRELRRRGRHAAVRAVCTAAPTIADSTTLDAAGRARRARTAFRPRRAPLAALARQWAPGTPGHRPPPGPSAGPPHGSRAAPPAVIVVDDIMTTGSTIAAVSRLLVDAGILVTGAAVLAATRRWS